MISLDRNTENKNTGSIGIGFQSRALPLSQVWRPPSMQQAKISYGGSLKRPEIIFSFERGFRLSQYETWQHSISRPSEEERAPWKFSHWKNQQVARIGSIASFWHRAQRSHRVENISGPFPSPGLASILFRWKGDEHTLKNDKEKWILKCKEE